MKTAPTRHDSREPSPGNDTNEGTTRMKELYIGSHLSTAGGWNALLERSHEEGGTAFAFDVAARDRDDEPARFPAALIWVASIIEARRAASSAAAKRSGWTSRCN